MSETKNTFIRSGAYRERAKEEYRPALSIRTRTSVAIDGQLEVPNPRRTRKGRGKLGDS